jgi:transglutaminase/protease-like cytokinesis protein 3
MSRQIRSLALLLAVLLLAAPLSGCRPAPAPETTTQETLAPEPSAQETAPQETAPAPVEENRCGTTWIKVFGDRALPADGWLEPDQVGFYFPGEDGKPYVTVMTVSELLQRVEDMGNLPRCRYFQDMLDERYDLVFAAYDMALALGCRHFAFPTSDLRNRDLTDADDHLYYTFMMYGCTRQYASTRDLEGPDGETFRFLTVLISTPNEDDIVKHTEAVNAARQIVAEMPEDLDELGKAKYLYEYVCKHVRYNWNDYYGGSWNALYDALVKNSTVCVGYAEALATLYNLAGIECMYADGMALIRPYDAGHAWNLAKVDGEWYMFDATLDENGGHYQFTPRYFGISTEVAEAYHKSGYTNFLTKHAPACEGILDPEYTKLPGEY